MPDELDIKLVEVGYLRLLLKANPFAYLSSESLERVTDVHVDTKTDELLAKVVDRVVSGSKELVFLVGEFGTGKTHRLRLMEEMLTDFTAVYVKVDVDDFSSLLNRIASVLRRSKLPKPLSGRLPEDEDELYALIRDTLKKYEYVLFMLDEAENLVVQGTKRDAERFVEFLKRLYSDLDGGKMIVIACVPPAYDVMKSLLGDIQHAVIRTNKIGPKEAEKILKKRIRHYRESLNLRASSLGLGEPFTDEMVAKMNELAGGNPRRLMKIARNVLAMLTKEFKEGSKVDPNRLLKMIAMAEGGDEEEVPPQPLLEDSHNEDRPEIRAIIERFPPPTEFSVIQLSRVLGLGLVEARNLVNDLLEEGVVEKTGGGRYRIKTSS